MMRRRLIASVILAALFAVPVFGGDAGDWSNLRKLKPGVPIGVIQSDQKRVEGGFESFSDAGLTLRGGPPIVIPKDSVVRVYRRPHLRRGWRAVLGAAIGVAAGAILSSTVGDRYRNEGQDVPTAGWVLGGAAIGAGIGAASGGGDHTVYRRIR